MHTLAPRFGRVGRASGFTLIELLIVVALIGVLAAIAFPLLLRARITSHEGTAIASLRTIHSAEAAYAASCASGGYAQTLEDLAKPAIGSSVGFISDPFTANGAKQSGYVASVLPAAGAFTMLDSAGTCNASALDAVSRFVAERHPISMGDTGVRSFAIDTDGTIYFRYDGVTIDGALTGAAVLP